MSKSAKRKPDDFDRMIADAAEAEAEVQLKVIRALKPLDREARQRVIDTLGLLLRADSIIPGILDAVLYARTDEDLDG
jgi:hypothetical protein